MPNTLIVVNNVSRWPLNVPGVEIVAARSYLTDPGYFTSRHTRVFNLCRSYRYQSLGYYVSLLAEARGHRPVPSVSTLQDLKHQSLLKVISSDLDELIQKSLAPLQGGEFTLSIYFARNMARRYDRLARHLFNLFPAPLLRAQFRRSDGRWTIQNISPISANEIPENHRGAVVGFAREYFAKGAASVARRRQPRFFLALLASDEDPTPPSDPKALQKFVNAAGALAIDVEFVGRDDYGRVGEFDALFIRETTAVNNHTYRFARRAEAEGLVVIDDPTSIVRCTNKVYLAELLSRHNIASPKTAIVHRDNLKSALATLGLPCVLKQPDSAFSQGVVKAETEADYLDWSGRLLEKSEMLIGQEFVRTDFDWRIGILDRKPLYACKYFMARGHWQIYNHAVTDRSKDSADFYGTWETLPVEMAPTRIVRTALKAANLIGDGFYGVDLKAKGKDVWVIEVNDNPSIETGVEDQILKNTLYERVMECFLRRLERRRERG